MSKGKYSIIVHGGAGEWDKKPESKMKEMLLACKTGEDILKLGGSALDAVEAAVKYMEDCPVFNAGTGSVLSLNKQIEMDACIMKGNVLDENKIESGAIAGIKNTKNPISVAKEVMNKSDYALLISSGADLFAKEMNLEYENSKLFTKERIDNNLELLKNINSYFDKIKFDKLKELAKNHPDLFFGTVGAVAFDGENIVAGTSTGGTPFKIVGRVGDSPIAGAGNYADAFCGVSSTGKGEFSIKTCIAHSISMRYQFNGNNLKKALNDSLSDLTNKFGNENTGLICIDKNGIVEFLSNTSSFGVAHATQNYESKIDIIKN